MSLCVYGNYNKLIESHDANSVSLPLGFSVDISIKLVYFANQS